MTQASLVKIVEVTAADGTVPEPAWLARAESVHRQLRQQLPADYAGRMRAIFAGGARMALATAGERVLGVMVWRHLAKTYADEVYVDDLVTDQAARSSGVGHTLLGWAAQRAAALGCDTLSLDSGTQRQQAHKFYFREGMVVTSFHFARSLARRP
ncbi:MAG: GNAT family N-acetyltransferase [Nevskia sp.]|nr:GNAT family N-acetyltransferase [Nevskia sp.]